MKTLISLMTKDNVFIIGYTALALIISPIMAKYIPLLILQLIGGFFLSFYRVRHFLQVLAYIVAPLFFWDYQCQNIYSKFFPLCCGIILLIFAMIMYGIKTIPMKKESQN